tara:strand:- start:1019 stop:1861 length:843 start_codon:yes stop_codon:yes gene_type:complete
MKNILLTFILLTSGILFAQKTDSLKIEQIYQKIDSIKYSESDFLKMQKYFNENSELNKMISEKAKQGDENATDLLKILNLNYNRANEEYGKQEIKVLIHSYYMSIGIQEKFKKLNSEFDAKLDSLKSQKDYFEKEIKKDKQLLEYQNEITKNIAKEDYFKSELRILTDLEIGIEQAQSEKKPILLYFTGYAVVNSRKIESDLLLKNTTVHQLMKNDYINVWLFVDDRNVGKKWYDYQKESFKSNVQPYFVILDSNGNPISKGLGYSEAKANLETELLKNK